MALEVLNDVVHTPRRKHETSAKTPLLQFSLETSINGHLGAWTAAVQIDLVVVSLFDQFRCLQQSVFVASSKLGDDGVFALFEPEP